MIVTLLTDFGLQDHYVGAMKGAILSRNPRITIVDISHGIAPHDTASAAFALGSCYRDFPPGTVHLVVVDPGVGSARLPICVSAGGYHFVGPDNGVLFEACGDVPDCRMHTIDPTRLPATRVSSTFHGRDVFAPVAADLASGTPIEAMGPAIARLTPLPGGKPAVSADGVVTGRVVHIDRFGNCITNLRLSDFEGMDWTRYRFRLAGTEVSETRRFYADGAGDEAFMIVGSTGRLEAAVDRGRAVDKLRIFVGDAIRAEPMEAGPLARGAPGH